MEPKSEKKVKEWSEKPPRPKEQMFPSWLLTCNCISCRKHRKRIGLERIEDEPTHKCKRLSEGHKRNIRIAMKKSWKRRIENKKLRSKYNEKKF